MILYLSIILAAFILGHFTISALSNWNFDRAIEFGTPKPEPEDEHTVLLRELEEIHKQELTTWDSEFCKTTGSQPPALSQHRYVTSLGFIYWLDTMPYWLLVGPCTKSDYEMALAAGNQQQSLQNTAFMNQIMALQASQQSKQALHTIDTPFDPGLARDLRNALTQILQSPPPSDKQS